VREGIPPHRGWIVTHVDASGSSNLTFHPLRSHQDQLLYSACLPACAAPRCSTPPRITTVLTPLQPDQEVNTELNHWFLTVAGSLDAITAGVLLAPRTATTPDTVGLWPR
jgi:hypothetical protein